MYKNKLLHKLALADNRQIRDPDFVTYLQQHQNIRHHPDSQQQHQIQIQILAAGPQQHQAPPPDAPVVPAPTFLPYPPPPPYVLDSVFKFYSPACLATLSIYILTARVDYLKAYFEQSEPEKWLIKLLGSLPAGSFSQKTDQTFQVLCAKADRLLRVIRMAGDSILDTVPYALRFLFKFRAVIENADARERIKHWGVVQPDLLACMAGAVTTAHKNAADIPIPMIKWAKATEIDLYRLNKWKVALLNALDYRLEFATEAVGRKERGGWVDRVGTFWREFDRMRREELELPEIYLKEVEEGDSDMARLGMWDFLL